MSSNRLAQEYGLADVKITDVTLSDGGWGTRHGLAADAFWSAWCPGQCGGGAIPVEDALRRTLDRMVAARAESDTVVASCPRSKPSSNRGFQQSCRGSVSATVRVQYRPGPGGRNGGQDTSSE